MTILKMLESHKTVVGKWRRRDALWGSIAYMQHYYSTNATNMQLHSYSNTTVTVRDRS